MGRDNEPYGPNQFKEGQDCIAGITADIPAGGTWAGTNKVLNGITVLPLCGLIGPKKIPDGVANTILYGEKYINMVRIDDPNNLNDNDQGWNLGYDREITRFTDQQPIGDYNDNVETSHCFRLIAQGRFALLYGRWLGAHVGVRCRRHNLPATWDA